MNNQKSKLSLKNVKIQDVMDVNFLQKIQDDFAIAVGVASVTVDLEGNPITNPSNFTEFCEIVHSTEIGCERCSVCDKEGGEEALRTGKPVIHECHAGLVDFAAPIILEGKLIGTILGGQVIENLQDEKKYEKIASEIGVESSSLIYASKKVKRVSKDQIFAAAEVLFSLSNNMVKDWYNKYKLNDASNTLNENLSQIAATMEQLAASAQELTNTQNSLNKEIDNVNTMSEQISEVLEFIKKIADETHMLGLNAAIEAARAGSAGLGFGIVAKEIRNLSSQSKETVVKIESFIDNIQSSIKNTVKMGDDTALVTEQQAAAVQEVTASIEEITALSENLNELAKKTD
ncbi:PocR ligand-binding domain-containing protein [Clostridium sp. D2Q-14]|uniref:PocR ligand-binding domain-containing protein n=1 Tax=Anaeromonas gelatinilytica TaxID=2683194 RepID=UPI00193AF4F6|nr:PocR ligand-binding domain-containing protein [Anaeromonas gelatinilytica]MBS4534532.1 PocR ligand-binding domain-containing protein [Anaeromonas gelatinilytica]